ncbi:MAG: PEGA domain-containing protein [Acidobacteriia bacterium]|nr:PEGA domain-containing protein [Terriglobia bacterium]
MGVVYKGFDPVIGRTVAIKTMLMEGLSATEFEDFKARFQREAQAAGILSHPNIVTVYDFGEDSGVLYLAMEYLVGRSLQDFVEAQAVLPVESIIPMFEQVCGALDHAHSHKIIHRDVKPANIMVLESGLVKVTDFGIAKIMSMGMTQAGQILGTPNYMSPEQIKGRQIDGRSDIFSLGVILYELVTGEKPFGGQNITTVIYRIINEDPVPPRELDASIHPGLSYIIQKALAKSPEERYQTCHELAEDLKNYENLGGAAAPSETVVVRVPPLAARLSDTARRPAVDEVAIHATPTPAQPLPPVELPPPRPLSVQVIPPPAPQPRGTPPAVWVLLILLLIGAGGGGYYFFVLHKPQPPAVVQTTSAPQPQAPATATPVESTEVSPNPQGESSTAAAPGTVVPEGQPAQGVATAAAPATGATGVPQEVPGKPAPQESKPPAGHEPTVSGQPAAARPQPVARVGNLLVTSSVSGAQITVDGKADPSWVTPFTISGLTAGTHSVAVAKDGYNAAQSGVTIEPGRTASYNAELTLPMGEINIVTNPPGLEILIDGQAVGRSPVQKTVGVGKHTFALRLPGMDPYTSSFEIKYNGYMITKRVELSGSIQAPTGVVEVHSNPPGASLQVDGQPAGSTTPTNLRLTAGHHILTISLAGYQSAQKDIDVPANGNITVNETLSH